MNNAGSCSSAAPICLACFSAFFHPVVRGHSSPPSWRRAPSLKCPFWTQNHFSRRESALGPLWSCPAGHRHLSIIYYPTGRPLISVHTPFHVRASEMSERPRIQTRALCAVVDGKFTTFTHRRRGEMRFPFACDMRMKLKSLNYFWRASVPQFPSTSTKFHTILLCYTKWGFQHDIFTLTAEVIYYLNK